MSRSAVPALGPPGADHWEFPRSTAGISLVLGFAAEHGLDAATVLRGTGLDPAVLADPGAVVPASLELTVLGTIATALEGDESAGLELGRHYHVTSFGILGYALMSSRTVAEAMSLALRFLDLSHIFTVPEVVVSDEEVVLALHAVGLPDRVARFVVDRDVAAIHTVLSELVPGGVPFSSVRLAFPEPAVATSYQAALGVAPTFDAEQTELRFAAEHLARPLPQANPHSQALAEQMCREVVARRRGRFPLTQEVSVWIAAHLTQGVSMARAADELAMSERTLRRRLASAGTGFQRLLDEVRRSLADEMLATDLLSIEDVAQRLGYAEASSFIHAFKRWHGRTPTQLRLVRRRRAASGSAG